jgi:HSP20 family protein
MAETNENVPTRRSFWSEVDPFRDFLRSPVRGRLFEDSLKRRREPDWSPPVNLSENPDGYLVTVELAGARKNDISVECHDKVLTIKGEKRDEREENEEHRHYVERSYGQFTRSFRMPGDASEDVAASFHDGVLTVQVKKHEAKKPTVVSISS